MTYVYAVIERAVLSNGDENRLMIYARVDAAHSVGTSGQATRDLGGQDAILGCLVKTFEEHELLRIQRLNRIQSTHRLNDHVAVAYDDPVVVDSL
jgi:hypothetical protein